MMNMDRFQPPAAHEETPFWKEQLMEEYIVPENPEPEPIEPPEKIMLRPFKITYLPTIHVFLAVERRLDRRIIALADDGFVPGIRRENTACGQDLKETYAPATHTEDLEVEVDHVWAYADSAGRSGEGGCL